MFTKHVRVIGVSAMMLATGCPSSTSTCVPGSTMACLCVGGASGVQSCRADGTFSACECGSAGLDASVPQADAFFDPAVDAFVDPAVDAFVVPGIDAAASSSCPAPLLECGGRCVDTSTDEANCGGCGPAAACAAGAFCVSGVCRDTSGACPPPFVLCGADCVDPRTSPDHCGATGGCGGASAGDVCDIACREGRCVYSDCYDARDDGGTTDGLYLIDPDGGGTMAPREVYCDQTTAGGGWMLVYKIRNDVPDIADPWWGMVALGSGTEFPTSPSGVADGMHFEGPTREVRQARHRTLGVTVQARGTLVGRDGTILLDVHGPDRGYVARAATGDSGALTPCTGSSSGSGSIITMIYAHPSMGFGTPLPRARECYYDNSGQDRIRITGDSAPGAGNLAGDESIGAGTDAMYRDSSTLFWLRQYRAE